MRTICLNCRFQNTQKPVNRSRHRRCFATLLKRDSNTGVLLLNLRNFWEHLFWRTSGNGCFWINRCALRIDWMASKWRVYCDQRCYSKRKVNMKSKIVSIVLIPISVSSKNCSKNWSFPLRFFSVNMTKFDINWRNP